MGVEYQHFLFPTEPRKRPSAERLASFIEALHEEGWIADGALDAPSYQSSKDRGKLPGRPKAPWLRERKEALRMIWPLNPPSRYPLTRLPYEREHLTWALEIHWSRWFLPCPDDELLRALATKSDCGDPLRRESWDAPFHWWLLTKCPTCKSSIDPSGETLRYDNPWGDESREVPGMGLHRFALSIDCGKAVPEDTEEGPVLIEPDLVALAKRHFDYGFVEDVGVFG